MNSKQRMKAAIGLREPDRPPMHMNATRWVIDELQRELGTKTQMELMEALHLDSFDMRGLDIHSGVMPRYSGPTHPMLEGGWAGDMLKIWSVEEVEMSIAGTHSYAIRDNPLSGDIDLGTIKSYPWPEAGWFTYDHLADALEQWSDYGITASGGSVFQHATFIRGMEDLLMDLLSDASKADFILDRFSEFYLEFYRRIFDAAGDRIDVFALADDLATQASLMISPEIFDSFVAQRIKEMADLAHRYDIKLLLHSCGNVLELIPRFIELGVDILDPLQPEAQGMDPAYLKKEFGSELCFRGGISAQQVLARGSKEEVRDETRRIIDILAPGGGYILSPGHPVLQDDIPVENIITMYETAYEYK